VYLVGYERSPGRRSFAPFLGFQLLGTAVLAVLGLGLARIDRALWVWTLLFSVSITLSEFSKTAFQETPPSTVLNTPPDAEPR
jgi:hypothetical protein